MKFENNLIINKNRLKAKPVSGKDSMSLLSAFEDFEYADYCQELSVLLNYRLLLGGNKHKGVKQCQRKAEKDIEVLLPVVS